MVGDLAGTLTPFYHARMIWPTHTLTQSLGYESLPEFFSEGLSLPGQPSPNT